MWLKPRWTGILVTGNEKNVKNKKWEWDLRIAKWDLEKNELGNGIGTRPPSGPSYIFVANRVCKPSILLTAKQFLASLSQFNLNSRGNSCLLVRTCPSIGRKPKNFSH